PQFARETQETYDPSPRPDDLLLTRARLEAALAAHGRGILDAVVIRTTPNDASKLARDYSTNSPPYFSIEAMRYLTSLPIQHLLVDTPSIDRLDDDGKLIAHRAFWNVAPGSYEVATTQKLRRSVTELIFVPDDVADGTYLLDLQIAPIASDAAPSRPV